MSSGTTDTNTLFNPFDEDRIGCPNGQYTRLRSENPVYWYAPLRSWILTRMDDVLAVLNDPEFAPLASSRSVAELGRRARRNYEPMIRVLDATLFFQDGPRHRQNRRTIFQVLNRITLVQLEPFINDVASDLASKIANLTEYDAISEFAEPLPQYVMAHILGLSRSDVPILGELLAKLTLVFDPITLDICDRVNRDLEVALDLLSKRVADAAGDSAESGLSIIYGATSSLERQRLTDAASTALFIYRVGSETTMGLIGVIIRTLLQQPALRRTACGDPSVIPAIVSEVLRLESNVQRSVRVSGKAKVVGGVRIQPGERITLLLGAANRDPAAFAGPDELRVDRKERSDVAFGAGQHFCAGAGLARLEGRIALEHLLRLPPIERAGSEEWHLTRTIRRLKRLPVRTAGD